MTAMNLRGTRQRYRVNIPVQMDQTHLANDTQSTKRSREEFDQINSSDMTTPCSLTSNMPCQFETAVSLIRRTLDNQQYLERRTHVEHNTINNDDQPQLTTHQTANQPVQQVTSNQHAQSNNGYNAEQQRRRSSGRKGWDCIYGFDDPNSTIIPETENLRGSTTIISI